MRLRHQHRALCLVGSGRLVVELAIGCTAHLQLDRLVLLGPGLSAAGPPIRA